MGGFVNRALRRLPELPKRSLAWIIFKINECLQAAVLIRFRNRGSYWCKLMVLSFHWPATLPVEKYWKTHDSFCNWYPIAFQEITVTKMNCFLQLFSIIFHFYPTHFLHSDIAIYPIYTRTWLLSKISYGAYLHVINMGWTKDNLFHP